MKKKLTFEEAMKQLEQIVDKLEHGEEPLEEALKLFEEGTSLAAYCYTALQNAQQKVEQLSAETEQLEGEETGGETTV